jgi:predicted RecA/RadA family phage recombinase
MKNKKMWLGMLVMVLAFGMTVLGCVDNPEDEGTQTRTPGDRADNPIDRVESIALGTMTSPDSGWRQLLNSINSTDKFINLDLSACTMTGTEFDPDSSVNNLESGKHYIVSIILPIAATSIKVGTQNDPTFEGFYNIRSVSGANISTIAGNILSDRLFGISLLESVNIPKVTNIAAGAFRNTGNGITAMSITMGSTAPTLGAGIFESTATKTVTVKVPAGASGYSPFTGTTVTVSGDDTSPSWANGLRGGGWNGTAFTNSSLINQKITVIIQQQ